MLKYPDDPDFRQDLQEINFQEVLNLYHRIASHTQVYENLLLTVDSLLEETRRRKGL